MLQIQNKTCNCPPFIQRQYGPNGIPAPLFINDKTLKKEKLTTQSVLATINLFILYEIDPNY